MISVIIPVYNGESVIGRCLDSVAAQTYEDIEMVVVDDGSSDGTETVVKGFGDPRIRYIRQQNMGQGMARNTGIWASCGEILAFVDADDTICRDMLECMERVMRESGADVVQCGINDIRGGRAVPRAVKLDKTVVVEDREEYAKTYFRGLYHTNEVCNKLIRKEFLEKNGLRFEDTRLIFSEDLLLNIEMLSCVNVIAFVDKPLYNYYISESGHCLGGERLEKICRLFEKGISDSCAEVVLPIKCVAAEVIAEYCATERNADVVGEVLSRKSVRDYFLASARYDCSLKHSVLMTALAILPIPLKLGLIELYVGSRRDGAENKEI